MKKIQFTIVQIPLFILSLFAITGSYAQSSFKDGPSLNSEDRNLTQQIDKVVNQLKRNEAPGTSIAVLRQGKIIYSKGIGEAQLEYGVPINTNTIFHVASVSKQFTAFSIALLADENKLSLDEDIHRYLPELPDFGQKITIRNLIHHTSGLRDQWELLVLAGWRPDDVITEEHILKLVYKQKELNFKPGEEFQYSNTNYTLLAKIVENVTRKKFTVWTQENIFQPLKMQHTFFYDDHEKIVKNRAYSYSEDNNGFKKQVLSYDNVGATSLFTTAEDLALWANNFTSLKVGNTNTMDLMNEKGVLNNGQKISYAFGQELTNYKGLNMVVHGGADAGYRSYLVRFPDQELAVVVLSNLASFDVRKLGMDIVNICLSDEIKKQEKLSSLTGQYQFKQGIILKISLENNELKAQIQGKNDIHHLVPITDNQFDSPSLQAKFTFERNSQDEAQQVTFEKDGQGLAAQKMEINSPDKSYVTVPQKELLKYEGTYEIQKPRAFEIWLSQDTLRTKITGKRDVHALIPLSQNEFDIPSLDAKITFNQEKVNELTFSKGGQSIKAHKQANKISETDLSDYTGKYYSEELSTFYTFILDQGKLLAQHPRHPDIPLEYLDRDFLTTDWYIKEIKVIRDSNQSVLGLRISTNRTKNLWFKKIE